MMSVPLPPPRLTRIFRLEANLGEALNGGNVVQGQRRIVPLTGGRFIGPELSGTLLPGASADWQIVLPDGTVLGDIRYTLQSDQGQLSVRPFARSAPRQQGGPCSPGSWRGRRSERVCVPHGHADRDGGTRLPVAEQKCVHQCRRPSTRRRDLRGVPGRMKDVAPVWADVLVGRDCLLADLAVITSATRSGVCHLLPPQSLRNWEQR